MKHKFMTVARYEKGFTLQHVSNLTGISTSRLSLGETGQIEFSDSELGKLTQLLEVKSEKLLSWINIEIDHKEYKSMFTHIRLSPSMDAQINIAVKEEMERQGTQIKVNRARLKDLGEKTAKKFSER